MDDAVRLALTDPVAEAVLVAVLVPDAVADAEPVLVLLAETELVLLPV